MEKNKIVDVSTLTLADMPDLHFTRPNHRTGRGKRGVVYAAEVCAFDIETTTLDDIQQSFMYVWQFAIEDKVFIGRTWEDFRKFLKYLKIVSNGYRVLVFVHNLSYEFQFLSGIYHFDNEDVFCTESRKILYCVLNDWVEFRCSYLLSNMSLAELTNKYNVEHKKLSGEDFDYSIKRYPWTPITDTELQYCINDVLGLVESVHAIMELYNDTLYTLPLTSTGFVRREVKRAMHPFKPQIKEIFPDYEVFKLLRAEFRGGNTHANRYYTGDVIRQRGNSYDISSSYPSAQCNRLYPVTPFKELVNPSPRLIDHLIEREKALIFHVKLYDVKLRCWYWAVPYIPLAKCISWKDIQNDNGRILSASMVELSVTDIDWKIIVEEYSFSSCEVIRGYKSNYGKLLDGIRETNIQYFKAKTELKGIAGQELYYMKSKNLLNSIYGMSCQNPAKALLLFNDCLYEEDTTYTEKELLERSKKQAFTVYQFACWTTSHARAALEEGIKICGDSLLYVDTDSCKVIGERDFTSYNERQKQAALESGLYATDKNGVTHYGGVFEFDGAFDAFCTLGAKKYCYIDTGGKLHLTVSGVGKKRGAAALEAAGGIDAFKPGFIFHNCGKTASVYNDENFGEYNIDGHTLNITRNVVIEEKDYTLSLTDDYEEIIKQSKQFLQKMGEFIKNTTL